MMHLILVGAFPESLINFRGLLIQELVESGYRVTTMSNQARGPVIKRLQELGARFYPYSIERSGLSPLADLKTCRSLIQAFRKLQPDIILAYTIKPVVWGGVAAYLFPNARFYALITGLGFVFQGNTIKRKLLRRLVTLLYRTALKRADRVIFQNSDNLNEFIQRGIVPPEKCFLVHGSGVDLNSYERSLFPRVAPITFLSIGRLLGEKGFREYAQAAKIVKLHYPEAIFQLLGPEDPSPDGITLDEIRSWHKQGWVEYLGSTNDVRPYLQKSHVYVLPSYHEGMPRTVLEAMAMGRPILTTDVPGCRETVVNGENGWLVEKANVEQLAERMIWFIENQDKWSLMGEKSHTMANEKFDVHKVNAEILKIMGLSDEKAV